MSILGGGIVVWLFHTAMQRGMPPNQKTQARVSSHITGFLERAVFTALMIAQPENAPVAMGGWLALKMAASWNRDLALEHPADPTKTHDSKLEWASHAFLGLRSGFLSMTFAGAGGILARYLMGLQIIH